MNQGLTHTVQLLFGQEMMLGSPAMARVMGADPDVAKVVDGPHDVWVCEPCVLEKMLPLFTISERSAP